MCGLSWRRRTIIDKTEQLIFYIHFHSNMFPVIAFHRFHQLGHGEIDGEVHVV
jgi:hypothetical protein